MSGQMAVPFSARRQVKELYLSIFVLWFRFRLGTRPANLSFDAHAAAMGVSIIESVLVLSLFLWMQILIGHRIDFNTWVSGIAGIIFFAANDYFLVAKGSGVDFEKQFSRFSKGKRITLRMTAIGIVLASAISVYLSVTAYHQAFNIRPPQGL